MLTLFLLQLMVGISIMWCLLPREKITAGFFRIQMMLMLGLSVLAGLTGRSQASAPAGLGGWWICLPVLSSVSAYAGSVAWTLDRRRLGECCLGVVTAANLLSLLSWRSESWMTSFGAGGWWFVSDLSSAGLLGGFVTGMLLGHWYLTAPMMSLEPLQRQTQLTLVATLWRGLLSCGWFFSHARQEQTSAAMLLLVAQILRWWAGIILPLILCIMIFRILRYRNTQSATGVFFAGVILVFLGELAAMFLRVQTRWPL
ncbi:MAG: hypothetical protein KatS3mg114_0339 [Planctomycetaceae bacterium]|nr:MAG: hypothetical protein KatS3mg114_0339 [Planctomycetaceae bacterium]